LVSLIFAIQATGFLAFTLAGLTPAEHICLIWTHNLVRNFTPWAMPANAKKIIINMEIFEYLDSNILVFE